MATSASHERLSASDRAEQREQLLLETSLELASSLELGRSCSRRRNACAPSWRSPTATSTGSRASERLVCLASSVAGVYDASWVGQEFRLADRPCDRLAVETRRAVTVTSLDDPRLSEEERKGCAATASAASSRCP